MAGKIDATVRLASFDYRAIYKEPMIRAWSQRSGEIGQALYAAFSNWGVSLDHVSEAQGPGSLRQAGLFFQLFQGKFVFRVGVGEAGLFAWNPDWSDSETITNIVTSALEVLRAGAQLEFAGQEVTLEMHLSPAGTTVGELTRGFLPSRLGSIGGAELRACGFSLHTSDRLWQVDLSAIFPESVFVKILLKFPETAAFGEIKERVHAEETKALNLLALRIPGFEGS